MADEKKGKGEGTQHVKRPKRRTEMVGGRTVIHCDCGMSYKLREGIDYVTKPVLCKRCLRVYRQQKDGSFRKEKGRADEDSLVKVKDVLPRGKMDGLLGLSGLMEDPGDSMHVCIEMLRAGGVLPTSPSRRAVDRVRQVWRAIKKQHGDVLDQELAHAMDDSIDWLDREAGAT